MNCDQFHERLNLLLDCRSAPNHDKQLSDHAAVCSDCESTLRLQSIVSAELKRDRRRFVQTPLNVPEILSGLKRRDGARRMAAGTKTVISLVISSACLLMIAIGWSMQTRSNANSHIAVVKQIPAPTPTQIASNARKSSQDSRPVSGAAVALVQKPKEEVLSPWIERMEAHLSSPDSASGQSIQTITGGLAPVKSSLSTAVEVIRKTLIPASEREPSKPQAGRVDAIRPIA